MCDDKREQKRERETMTRAQKNIKKLDELFKQYLIQNYDQECDYAKKRNYIEKHKGKGHDARVKVTSAAKIYNYTTYELYSCDAAFRVFYGNGGNAYNTFISRNFLIYIDKNEIKQVAKKGERK